MIDENELADNIESEDFWISTVAHKNFSKWINICVAVGASSVLKNYTKLAQRHEEEQDKVIVFDSLNELSQIIYEDSLTLDVYDYNTDSVKKVGDPQNWKHKQKKRPWN